MHHVQANGVSIPALGFGTWALRDEVATRMVTYALEVGYRHIDTAQMYANESAIGEALDATPVPREEIFITTKIWPDRLADGVLQAAAEESVRRLRVDAVDLLLLHWPNPAIELAETLRALNQVRREGLTRHIGVSNFTTALMAEANALSEAPLIANQVEYHPYLDQSLVLGTARSTDMAVIAYSPLATGKVHADPVLERIGARYGKTAGQVTLRWLIQQRSVCAIPRSSRERNAARNFEVFDFELRDEEMSEIANLARPDGRLCDHEGLSPEWD